MNPRLALCALPALLVACVTTYNTDQLRQMDDAELKRRLAHAQRHGGWAAEHEYEARIRNVLADRRVGQIPDEWIEDIRFFRLANGMTRDVVECVAGLPHEEGTDEFGNRVLIYGPDPLGGPPHMRIYFRNGVMVGRE